MSKAKTITSGYTNVISPEGELVTLGPGDTVPDWATVTNPALFEKSDKPAATSDATGSGEANTGSGEQSGGQTQTAPPATKDDKGPGVAELRQQAKDLGISAAGSKKDLAARIAEKQAEDAKAAAEEPDGGEDDRAALEAKAKELGIEFDENNSDEELAALIEDKE